MRIQFKRLSIFGVIRTTANAQVLHNRMVINLRYITKYNTSRLLVGTTNLINNNPKSENISRLKKIKNIRDVLYLVFADEHIPLMLYLFTHICIIGLLYEKNHDRLKGIGPVFNRSRCFIYMQKEWVISFTDNHYSEMLFDPSVADISYKIKTLHEKLIIKLTKLSLEDLPFISTNLYPGYLNLDLKNKIINFPPSSDKAITFPSHKYLVKFNLKDIVVPTLQKFIHDYKN
jgi:hypothetical protein